MAFKTSPFWSQLSSTLKLKLVKATLIQYIETMNYFFAACEGCKAPEGFIIKVMVSLDSSRYEHGDLIVKKGDVVKDLYFIMNGTCSIFGTHRMAFD